MKITSFSPESLAKAIERNAQISVAVHPTLSGIPKGSILFAALTAQLQQILGLTVDGRYGPITAKAASLLDTGHVPGWHVNSPDGKLWIDAPAGFDSRPRKSPVTRLVLHENVGGNDVAATAEHLKKDKLGIHFMIQWDGLVTCLEPDFLSKALRHGGALNSHSIAIEFASPYTSVSLANLNADSAPARLGPWSVQIPKQWWTWVPAGGQPYYRCLSRAQMEAAARLVDTLLAISHPNMAVPLEFPTAKLVGKLRGYDNKQNPAVPGPGIVAHADYSSHADGRFPLEYIRFRAPVSGDITPWRSAPKVEPAPKAMPEPKIVEPAGSFDVIPGST